MNYTLWISLRLYIWQTWHCLEPASADPSFTIIHISKRTSTRNNKRNWTQICVFYNEWSALESIVKIPGLCLHSTALHRKPNNRETDVNGVPIHPWKIALVTARSMTVCIPHKRVILVLIESPSLTITIQPIRNMKYYCFMLNHNILQFK